MPTEIIHQQQPGAVQPHSEADSILAVIARAATDDRVDVAKMTALLDLRERVMARQAEIEFNRDFASASAEMPRVTKRGIKDMGEKGTIPFAKYDDLDSAIRPIEKKYGFTRTFLYSQTDRPGVLITLKLTHRAGHSEKSTRHMAPDKGPGRNDAQAEGSAGSYLLRYMTLAIWNIITVGADDDAAATGYIDDHQLSSIVDMTAACNMGPESQSKFLEVLGVKTMGEIRCSDYARAMQLLQAKLRKIRGEK